VNTKLQDRLTDLKTAALRFPASMEDLSAAILWDKPSDDPDLADAEKIRESFNREAASTAYKEAVDDFTAEYGTRDAQAAKMQNDLLASFQQGFVMRHRSRMQLMVDASSTRKVVNESKVELLFERQIANVESAK